MTSPPRWLEWITAAAWMLVGAGGYFYGSILRPTFASFGGELPWVTSAWVFCGPLFLLALWAAGAGAALLSLRPQWRAQGPTRRALWIVFAAAPLAAVWSVWAAFAPMFF